MLRVLLSAFILFGLCVSAGVPAAYAKNKTPVDASAHDSPDDPPPSDGLTPRRVEVLATSNWMDQELFFNVSQNVLVCDVSLADEKAQAAYSARIRYSIHGTFRNDPPRGYGCPSLTVHQQVWARVFQGAIELWLPKGWGKKDRGKWTWYALSISSVSAM
jgi:hypothetical protein